jgi:hypothetical protein
VITVFNKFRIAEENEWLIIFRIRYELFEFLIKIFDLFNIFSFFQNFIHDVFRLYFDIFYSVYLNDVIIYNNLLKEYRKYVRVVLIVLKETGLYLDIFKCEFYIKEIKFLDLIISTNGICIDPAKIQTVIDWQRPIYLKNVQIFVKFANYYRRFIEEFFDICKFMIIFSKKNIKFRWFAECEKAF